MTRLVFFDLETTGLDPEKDRIVELAMSAEEGEVYSLVNPGMPIPAEATATHGITDDDVRGAPPFRELVEAVEGMLEDAVLVGYNSLRFDVPFLDAELRRAGRPGLARGELGEILARDIDLYRVWAGMETRNLTAAARRFAGVDLGEGAHRARQDTGVLLDVLHGMLAEFTEWRLAEPGEEQVPLPLDELQRMTAPPEMVDRAGKFKRREDGKIVYAFGQHQGLPVAKFPDYLSWMLLKDFPAETKEIARRLLARLGERG